MTRPQPGPAETRRSSGAELLRILCMLLIVFSHAGQYALGVTSWHIFRQPFSPGLVLTSVVGLWGQTAAGAFIAVSSYYQCEKTGIRTRKILMLLMQTVLLDFCLRLGFEILPSGNASPAALISGLGRSLISPFTGDYWFIPAYLFFYLLTPVLQTFAQHASDRVLTHTALTMTVLVSCVNTVVPRAGGPVMDFVYVFVLVVFLRRFREEWMKKNCIRIFFGCAGLIFSGCMLLSLLSEATGSPFFRDQSLRLFVHYNPVVAMASVSLMWIFTTRVRVPSCRLITIAAGSALGVYILHENPWVPPLLWGSLLQLAEVSAEPGRFFLRLLGGSLGVFIVCTALESLRGLLIDRLLLGRLRAFDRFCTKLDSLCAGPKA